MKNPKFVALLGAGLLLFGSFSPLVSFPIAGSVNLLAIPGPIGVLMLGFAAAIALFATFRRHLGVLVSGIFAGLLVLVEAWHVKSTLFNTLEGSSSNFVQLQWGWVVLIFGVILSIVGAIGGDRVRSTIPYSPAVPPPAVPIVSDHTPKAAKRWLTVFGIIAGLVLAAYGGYMLAPGDRLSGSSSSYNADLRSGDPSEESIVPTPEGTEITALPSTNTAQNALTPESEVSSAPPMPSLATDRVLTEIPDSIRESIRAVAQEKWPSDSFMQAATIQQEELAYRSVMQYTVERVPATIVAAIKSRASAEWPDSYSMQESMVRSQTDAYLSIQAWNRSMLPPDIGTKIKTKAMRDWPNSYTMQLSVAESEAAAYEAIQAINAPSMNVNALVAIKEDAAKDWPDSYSLQKLAIEAAIASGG